MDSEIAKAAHMGHVYQWWIDVFSLRICLGPGTDDGRWLGSYCHSEVSRGLLLSVWSLPLPTNLALQCTKYAHHLRLSRFGHSNGQVAYYTRIDSQGNARVSPPVAFNAQEPSFREVNHWLGFLVLTIYAHGIRVPIYTQTYTFVFSRLARYCCISLQDLCSTPRLLHRIFIASSLSKFLLLIKWALCIVSPGG